MGYDLSRGNSAIALLINSLATGIALFILITIFINVSGAHFNPLVTLVSWSEGEINNETFIKYFLSQFMGALLGIVVTHIIFYLSYTCRYKYSLHLYVFFCFYVYLYVSL